MTLANIIRPNDPKEPPVRNLANIIRPNDPKEPTVRNLANYLSPEDRERSYQARANAEAAQRADREAMLRLYDTLNNIGRFPTF